MKVEIVTVDDTAALSRAGAEFMANCARTAIAERGRCVVALAGGSTVRTAYELLSQESGIDWRRVYVFWGDERFVDLANPYSNYGLAKAALLDRAPIPAENIFPVPVGEPAPGDGARRYEATIREVVGGDGIPVFDLVQVGMGPDGHTASLFPHSAALAAGDALVAPNHAGLAPWVDRITFTFPLINAARSVLILAGGQNKAAHIKEVVEGTAVDVARLPIAGVRPVNGAVTWVVDKAAGSLLGK